MTAETQVALTPTEAALLDYFQANPNRVLSRRQIISVVWNGTDVKASSVELTVCHLRQKLPTGEIQTRRGLGYVWRPTPPDDLTWRHGP